jgi:hypothetical protein
MSSGRGLKRRGEVNSMFFITIEETFSKEEGDELSK